MILFIILPFLGGYVGYVNAPEKVVEMENVVEVENEPLPDSLIRSNDSSEFKLVWGFETEIPQTASKYYKALTEAGGSEYGEPTSGKLWGRKLTASTSFIIGCINCTHSRNIHFIFDEETEEVLRVMDYNNEVSFGSSKQWSLRRDSVTNKLINVLIAVDDKKVTAYDFYNGTQEVIYNEPERWLSLCETVVMSCVASFSITQSGNIFFGKYVDVNSLNPREFFDLMTVNLPERYEYPHLN